MINGLLCTAEIRAVAISCPACGAPFEIRVGERHSRIFDRQKQRFRCSRCRFSAPVHVIVDVGVGAEGDPAAAAQ